MDDINTNTTNSVKVGKKAEKNQPQYSKAQALKSKLFEKNRDALAVILDDKKSYTKAEINEALKKFYERKVK